MALIVVKLTSIYQLKMSIQFPYALKRRAYFMQSFPNEDSLKQNRAVIILGRINLY